MKNTIIFLLFTFAFSLAAFAVPSWVEINTDAYGSKTGLDNVADYSAYYCTAEAAKTMFGSSSVDALTAYFSKNFATGETKLMDDATELDDASWSATESYYTFYKSLLSAPDDVDYVGFVLFGTGDEGERAFRVFGSDNPEVDANYVAFDSATATDRGRWTTVIPEPTSALLLLVGIAGLALKRRNLPFRG